MNFFSINNFIAVVPIDIVPCKSAHTNVFRGLKAKNIHWREVRLKTEEVVHVRAVAME